MAWVILIGSGFLEAVWAVALSKSNGFEKVGPILIFLLANVASIAGLAIAMKTLPTGTSYAVWTATGATVTVVYSFITGADRATMEKILLILTLVSCVVGLKVVS